MKSKKLDYMISILSKELSDKRIPFCLIGAMALSVYGLPRYTADIDLLSDLVCWPEIYALMERLGYECFQKTETFAQFDSELGVYGTVDFMFVRTQEGKDILKQSVLIEDDIFGRIPVIQPSDYVILKLMAIANNPERSAKDESDLSGLFELYDNELFAPFFDPLDVDRILLFAERFGQRRLIEKYLKRIEIFSGGDHCL